MKKSINLKILFLIAVAIPCFTPQVYAQKHMAALAMADTSRFSVNAADGWQLFNSYVSQYKKDSAQLELVVQHTNNIDWKKEQYIGKIKNAPLHPSREQTVFCPLLYITYRLRIDIGGKCYITYIGNSLPTDNPVVIPLKLFYKL